ncbi:MAG: iron transporter, partial [Firmicutes bacterium]|nr:iron transporter [Bacillota bacterium]
MKKAVALLLTAVMAFGVTATAVHAEAGFEEIPIFEDEEVGFMNVSAVYFQPVPLAPGQEDNENYNMH